MRSLATIITFLLISFCACKPSDQEPISVPGYPQGAPPVYAGYVTTVSESQISYVLIQNQQNNAPLTLWLNGGPGCSSLIGFLQQIGPYVLPPGTPYSKDDQLKQNKFSWNKLSSLLFFDTPPGVGYSIQGSDSYIYNDQNTVQQNMNALIQFYKKFPIYEGKQLYLAAQSYGGKFIADLTLKILSYNMNTERKINIKGILIGNGIIDLSDDRLEKSQINYMFSHNFIDPTLQKYWQVSCQTDPSSAGCSFFFKRYDQLLNKVNFHSIYGNCSNNKNSNNKRNQGLKSFQDKKGQFLNMVKKCQYYDGIQDYFTFNADEFKSKKSKFVACNQKIFETYDQNPSGSVSQLSRIIAQTTIKVFLYSGDWDDLVPIPYTMTNLQRMGLRQNGPVVYWVNQKTNQHIGFKRQYLYGQRSVKYWIIKGAGHEAPRFNREAAYQIFQNFIKN